ncbi:DUF4419 domain-containing protein [Dysgonomonas sp. 25]|uniref:DUF4419 domain-containing protein n=1 Tax=Dysgonomonas sp. 25 TaxID=2302933 RepID=UPI0013D399A3|nr:DUF4419 domain-containing protein [Dysgonomonas sp. 25]NDV69535.1 DUF4419 domain-containing protein [Dysgonomonas sp. 25]
MRITGLFLGLFISLCAYAGVNDTIQPPPQGVTFAVDTVVPAESYLPEMPIDIALYRHTEMPVLTFPDEHRDMAVVGTYKNSLMTAINRAYSDHRPLILSPDVIWLAICQGVSIHITENINTLEDKLFVKDKPKVLNVYRPILRDNSADWQFIIDRLSAETRKYTKKDFHSYVVGDFSTTTPASQMAYKITLLEAYKKVFAYQVTTLCGIPSVTLTGTREDWEVIYNKLDYLSEIGLEEWADCLRPVIQEFIDAYDGKVNTQFWQSIYKDRFEYDSNYLSGWCIKFFPYLKKCRDCNGYIPNRFLEGDAYLISRIRTENIPDGNARIDVTICDYTGTRLGMRYVFGGFMGLKQYNNKAIEPFISWVICREEKKGKGKKEEDMTSNGDEARPVRMTRASMFSPNPRDSSSNWDDWMSWSPSVEQPVYDKGRFETQEESLNYIKDYLETAIRKNTAFKEELQKEIEVEFVIRTTGKMDAIGIRHNNVSKALRDFIKKKLKELPGEWTVGVESYKRYLNRGSHIVTIEGMKDYNIQVNTAINITIFEQKKTD